MGKWAAKPELLALGEGEVKRHGVYLRDGQDFAPHTVRIYLSELRQFACFCEVILSESGEADEPYSPSVMTTLTNTLYRSYLRTALVASGTAR